MTTPLQRLRAARVDFAAGRMTQTEFERQLLLIEYDAAVADPPTQHAIAREIRRCETAIAHRIAANNIAERLTR